MFKYFEWLLLAFPLLGAALNGLLGRRFPRRVQNRIACGAVVGSLLIALPLLAALSTDPGLIGRPSPLHWIRIGMDSRLVPGPLALRVDALSIAAVLTALVGGWFIHLTAARRLENSPARHVILALLNGALAMLLAAVLADNVMFLLLGWSLSGWCGYGLFATTSTEPGPALPAHWPVLLASDLCLLLAVGVASQALVSLSLHHVIALAPARTAEAVTPEVSAAVTVLIAASAAIRAALFPFHVWISEQGNAIARATTYGLLAVLPGVYLFARVAPLIAQVSFLPSLLSWWGAAAALLMAVRALLQSRTALTYHVIALSQVGLVLLALGIGAHASAVAFLPALVLSHSFAHLTRVDAGTRDTVARLRRLSSWVLTALPALVFGTQLLEAAFYRHTVQGIVVLLTTILLAASATRLWHAQRTRPQQEAAPSGGVLLLAPLLVGALGAANLISPPPAGRFLAPVLGTGWQQPAWWWFGIALLSTGLGVLFGYALRARLDTPAPGVVRRIVRGTMAQELFEASARRLLQASQFVAHTIEPLAHRWTFGLGSRLLAGPAPADPSRSDPGALSVLWFLLGIAGVVAILLLQKA